MPAGLAARRRGCNKETTMELIGLAVAGFCLTWAAMDVVALVVRRLVRK